MRKSLFLLTLILVLSALVSCEEEAPNVTGQFQLEIESRKELQNISLFIRELSPVESSSSDIQFQWEEISNRGSTKVFRSGKILMGTYDFQFAVKYLEDDGRNSYGNRQYRTFQIIPGEVTKIYGVYFP